MCSGDIFLRNKHVCTDCVGKSVIWPAILHGCYRDSRAASVVTTAMLSYHRMQKTWQQDVNRYIALTEFCREKFVEGGLPASRLSVKSNFLDPDPGVGKGGGDYAVFVGRLSAEKGVETLLEAWPKLNSTTRLKIIGDGPMANVVREAAAADERIEYVGWLDLKDACEIISNAACMIMPSIWFETFGRTIVEAFAVGTPVVASNMGSMSELMTDGETGLVFEPGNPQDLADKVQQLLGDPRHKREMRYAARAEYEAKYTADANYPQLMEIYRMAIEDA